MRCTELSGELLALGRYFDGNDFTGIYGLETLDYSKTDWSCAENHRSLAGLDTRLRHSMPGNREWFHESFTYVSMPSIDESMRLADRRLPTKYYPRA
jgi:hypothetical protein